MDATPSFPRFMAISLSRTPCWRYQRAISLVDTRKHLKAWRDDEWTAQLTRYLRDLLRYPSGRRHQRVIAAYPTIHAAVTLHDHDRSTSLMVQARLLARQSVEQIADLAGIDPDVLEAYESLFFDVRPHIDARDWIVSKAVYGDGLDADTSGARILFRSLAFHLGPVAIEASYPYLVEGRDLFNPPPDLSTAEGRMEQRFRLMIAMELLALDEKNIRKLHKVNLLLMEWRQKSAVNATLLAKPARDYAYLIQKALGEVPEEKQIDTQSDAEITTKKRTMREARRTA